MGIKIRQSAKSGDSERPAATTTDKPTKLSDVLNSMADKLVADWAQEQKHALWLGGPSRLKVRDDVARLLREAYELAKERYSGTR